MVFPGVPIPRRLPRLDRWIEHSYLRLTARCNLFAVILCLALVFHEPLSYVRWMKSSIGYSVADIMIFGACRLAILVVTVMATGILFVGAGCFCGCLERLSRLSFWHITIFQLGQLVWCALLLGDDVHHVTKLQRVQNASVRAIEAMPLMFSVPAVISGTLATLFAYRSPQLPLVDGLDSEEEFEPYSVMCLV